MSEERLDRIENQLTQVIQNTTKDLYPLQIANYRSIE
jgi:hypothetical protein